MSAILKFDFEKGKQLGLRFSQVNSDFAFFVFERT